MQISRALPAPLPPAFQALPQTVEGIISLGSYCTSALRLSFCLQRAHELEAAAAQLTFQIKMLIQALYHMWL